MQSLETSGVGPQQETSSKNKLFIKSEKFNKKRSKFVCFEVFGMSRGYSL